MILKETLCAVECLVAMLCHGTCYAQGNVSGKVTDVGGEPVAYANVAILGSSQGTTTSADGSFAFSTSAGHKTVVATCVGYSSQQQSVDISDGGRVVVNFRLEKKDIEIGEVVVETAAGVGRVRRSAFNAVALDATEMYNTSKNLADALGKAPGVKLREAGGVGSDMNVMLDGFSGKHVKVFIDGMPQDGSGSSFGLNNLPVNMAERIEVYKGVVPVGFGTDAIGGVINVVTKRQRKGWHADASYSFGSFNTHKGYVDFGLTTERGLSAMLKLVSNYSDNNYKIETSVEDFERNAINTKQKAKVTRFNDTYHNEAIQLKAGALYKPWADRLMAGLLFSRMHKGIQNGVRQIIVYGKKYREGWSIEPSLEFVKRGISDGKIDVSGNFKFNYNSTTNVDTSQYHFNWYGDKKKMNSPGEQSYQNSELRNKTLNAVGSLSWRPASAHSLTLNHTYLAFRRNSKSHLTDDNDEDEFDKVTRKNITGLSYLFSPSYTWNASAFVKYYRVDVSGPVATTTAQDSYVEAKHDIDHWGFGLAGTCHFARMAQAKLSYERTCRLPSIDEMFGDEDLESGDMDIRPETSDNINLSLSLSKTIARHGLFAEVGLVLRSTEDYIKRNIVNLSGGKSGAAYVNYGQVRTTGFNASLRYDLDKRLALGANFTHMNVIDRQKTIMGSTGQNVNYGERMPNVPYMFADFDVQYRWNDLFAKGSSLSVAYDNQFLHDFCYYAENIGTANISDYMVPKQLSHNATISYSFKKAKYNISFEARNFTDENLYDNFSLQKAGRAFYGKLRVSFGSDKQ